MPELKPSFSIDVFPKEEKEEEAEEEEEEKNEVEEEEEGQADNGPVDT